MIKANRKVMKKILVMFTMMMVAVTTQHPYGKLFVNKA